jgi:hypothetical protein
MYYGQDYNYSKNVHVCNIRKFNTNYKFVFDDYLYYVICRLFTTLGRLTNWKSRLFDNIFFCLLLSLLFSRSPNVYKNSLHIHLANDFIGHNWYQPSLSGNHRRFNVSRQSQCSLLSSLSGNHRRFDVSRQSQYSLLSSLSGNHRRFDVSRQSQWYPPSLSGNHRRFDVSRQSQCSLLSSLSENHRRFDVFK